MTLSTTVQKEYASHRGNVAYWITRSEKPDAPCIFFLHGLTADHTMFDLQVPYFVDRYTVIAWDAPAHALSRPYHDFSYQNCAEDMRGILEQENIDRSVFAGQSMGGYLVQSFLLRYPEMALAFVAIDTCPYGLRYYSKSDLFWLSKAGAISQWMPYGYYVNTIIKSVALTERGQDNMRNAISFYGKDEFSALTKAGLNGFALENRDLNITCPVLILVGEKDRAGKVLAYSKAWHEATGYPIQIIENASHNSNVDNPDAVNAAIDAFLTAALSSDQVSTGGIS